jgi:hypothetical protein
MNYNFNCWDKLPFIPTIKKIYFKSGISLVNAGIPVISIPVINK